MAVALAPLPTLQQQADRLIELGVHELAALPAAPAPELLPRRRPGKDHALLVVDPQALAASKLAPLLRPTASPASS